MSDGLGRAIGAPTLIEWQGRTYKFGPLLIEDLGTVEHHLLGKKKNPIQEVMPFLEGLPPEMAEKLLHQAYNDARKINTISPEEMSAWLSTIEGIGYTVWLCLERNHKGEFTVEQVIQMLGEMSPTELEKIEGLRDQAAGLDQLGNSTGPAPAHGSKRRRARRVKRSPGGNS